MAKQGNESGSPPAKRGRQVVPPLPVEVVAGLFKKYVKNGIRPSLAQCVWLRNDIAAVANSPPPGVLNDDPAYRQRRAEISTMEKLIRAQLARLKHQRRTLKIVLLGDAQDKAALEALQRALAAAEPALLAPFDHWAGERQGANWHKPARFLASRIHSTMIAAGRARVSFDKGGPLVNVVIGAMVLAGLPRRSPEAVAAALAKKSTT